MYIISTYDKHRITITDEEATQALSAKQAGELIIIRGNAIEPSNIAGIYREETEDKKFQSHGVLHDGTRVVRQFGQWYCDDGNYDEEGRLTVRPDKDYYPEVAVSVVATPEEWSEIGGEYYEINADRIQRVKLGTNKLVSIGSILGGYKAQGLISERKNNE